MALREHNFVRTDLSLQAQVHIVSVVYVGFFFGGPMLPDEFVLPDEEAAELMAETIHRTLETDRVISPEELEPVTRGYLESIDHYMALYEKQFQQELQGPA